jgi:parallel beta-helix repeat protein
VHYRITAVFLIIVVIAASFQVASAFAASVYYVATTGSDSNPGTEALPWRTIQKGVSNLQPGDTLYIRGGIYQEVVYVSKSGTTDQPIRILAYPGETPAIDGNNYQLANSIGSALMKVSGDWCIVSGLEIRRSGDMGIVTSGVHVTVDNIYAHHNWGAGIILTGNYDTAQNCRAWSNSMENENAAMSGSWGTGISCCRYPDYCTIRNSVAWDTWGEGISTFEALHTTIEDNVSFNNQQNFYISDTKYTKVQRNLSYCTAGNTIDKYDTQDSFLVGDEKGVPIPLPNGTRQHSSDNVFANNLAMGCHRNFAIGAETTANSLYAYNTAVNASRDANILFYAGSAGSNARFVNNLILQEDNIAIADVEMTGMNFSNNLWSRTPPSKASGPGDVIGDPQLAKTGSIAPGLLTPAWFQILASSPARNRAKVIAEVTEGFFRNARGDSPDIGAHEYIESPAITAPVASYAAASVYYVDNTCAYNGNGTSTVCASTAGGNGPFNSLANAQTALTGNRGDSSLLLKRGQTYNGQFTVRAYGTAGHPFTVSSYGTGANPIVSRGDDNILVSGGNYVVIDGITCTGATGQWGAGIYANGASYIAIQNCTVINSSYRGIFANGGGHITIKNNIVSNCADYGISISGAANNEVSGNDAHHNSSGFYPDGMNNSLIHNNKFHDNHGSSEEYGIGILSCSNNEWYENEIYNNHNMGVQFYGDSSWGPCNNNKFYRNYLHGHTEGNGHAINVVSLSAGYADNNTFFDNIIVGNNVGFAPNGVNVTGGSFYNNVFYGNQYGIDYGGYTTGGYTYRNNIFAENSANNIRAFYSPSFTHDHNLYYRASGGTGVSIGGTSYNQTTVKSAFEPTCVNTNPLFTGASPSVPTDFRLQSGSPAIDAGTNVGLTADYEGNPIVGNPDIGAYEYQGSQPTVTPKPTSTPSPTNTATPVPTNTLLPTSTSTFTRRPTVTPSPTNTRTPTRTLTPVPTNTLLPTSTPTRTMFRVFVPLITGCSVQDN